MKFWDNKTSNFINSTNTLVSLSVSSASTSTSTSIELTMSYCYTPHCGNLLGANDQGWCKPCTIRWYQQQMPAAGTGMSMGMSSMPTNAQATAAPTDPVDDMVAIMRSKQEHTQQMERTEQRARLVREAMGSFGAPATPAPAPQSQQQQPKYQAAQAPRPGPMFPKPAARKPRCAYCVSKGRHERQVTHKESMCRQKAQDDKEEKDATGAKEGDEAVEEVEEPKRKKIEKGEKRAKERKEAKKAKKEAGEKADQGGESLKEEQKELPQFVPPKAAVADADPADSELATANEGRAFLMECIQDCIRAFPGDTLQECVQRTKRAFAEDLVLHSRKREARFFEKIRDGKDGGALFFLEELSDFARELEKKE